MSFRNRRINRLSKRSASVLAAAAATATLSSAVFADSGTWTWTSGSTSWSNDLGWIAGNVPGDTTGDFSSFNVNLIASGPNPENFGVTMDINATLSSMSFTDSNTQSSNGWSIKAGTGFILLDNGSDAATITVNGLGVDTNAAFKNFVGIYAPLRGTAGLTKNGAGLLRLGANNSGLRGTLSINAGTLELAGTGQLNTVSSKLSLGSLFNTINMGGGVLSLRSDSGINLSAYSLNFTASGGINVDDGVDPNGSPSNLDGGAHKVGSILLTGAGARTLTVSGGHNTTLNVGVLVADAFNNGTQTLTNIIINNLSPGDLTFDSVISNNPGANNGNTTISLGGTGTTTIGGNIVVNNSVAQGSVNLSVVYNDVHTLTVGSFSGLTGGLFMNNTVTRSTAAASNGSGSITTFAGAGTLHVLSGVLPSGSLNIQGGTLIVDANPFPSINTLNAAVSQLTMGGGTISSGTLTPTIFLNGGTLLINSTVANIAVNTGTIAAGPGTTIAIQTLATLNGNLDLGSVPASIRVGTTTFGGPAGSTATTTFDIAGTVRGTGAFTKSGLGELRLLSANILSGPVTMLGGTLTGVAQPSGNALSSGQMTLTSGSLRAQSVSALGAGTVSVPTLSFAGDSLDAARLVADATSGSTATLSIGTFLGRVPGTAGVLTVIPQAGSLNTSEVVRMGFLDPSVNPTNFNNMFPAYMAAQSSGAAAATLDFLNISSNRVVPATYTTGTLANMSGATAIFATNSGTNTIGVGQTASVYSIKLANTGTASVGGGGTLSVGNGVQTAGVILNNAATINVGNFVLNTPEAVIWAGGSGSASVLSNITLNGNLLTAGVTTLNLNGVLNLNGTRTIGVDGAGTQGYAVLNGTLSGGNMVKTGPGTFSITGPNTSYTGTVTVNAGTLDITNGVGAFAGQAGNLASVATVILGTNGVLEFNKSGNSFTFNRPITGAGTVVQNDQGNGTLILSAGNLLSNFANLFIAQGKVQITNSDQLPVAVNVTIGSTVSNSGGLTVGQLDLNGNKSQSVGGLNGIGTVTNTANNTFATLVVNGGGSYGGNIADGAGTALVQLIKTGNATLALNASSSYTGQTLINGGTILIPQAAGTAANRLGNTATGSGTVIMNGGALAWEDGLAAAPSNAILVQQNSFGTLADVGNNGNQLDSTLNGTGALYFVKADNHILTALGNWSAFNGTIDFSQVNGDFRFNNTNNVNLGSDKAWFELGNIVNLYTRNGNSTTSGINMGALSGGPNALISGTPTENLNNTTWRVGSLNLDSTYAGTMLDGPVDTRVTGLAKFGTGTLTLTGTSITSGAYTINQGKLLIAGNGILMGNPTIIIGGTTLVQTITVNGASGVDFGVFALAGNGTMTGQKNITVNNGVFDVSAISYNNPPGVTLLGTSQDSTSGFVKGIWNQNAGTTSPGGAISAGTVAFGSAANPTTVHLTGGNTVIDIMAPGSIGSGFNDLIQVNGNIDIQAGAAFRLSQINDDIPITVGTAAIFPILTYTGSRTGTLTPLITAGFRGSFTMIETGKTLSIRIDSFSDVPPANLTWRGNLNSDWDTNITTNFQTGGSPATFFQQDNVRMDDSALTGAINVTATVLKPTLITVNNNTLDYTFSGLGVIGGSGGLVKQGTGTLVLLTRNTFTGGSTFTNGVVQYGRPAGGVNVGALGSGTTYLANATFSFSNNNVASDFLIPAGASSTLLFNSTPANGSGNWSGQFHGSGTLNLMGNGNNNGVGSININSDNSDFNGIINVWLDPNFGASNFSFRTNNQNGYGNAVWNFPQTAAIRATVGSQVADKWVSELPIGGLSGNVLLTSQFGGSNATGKRWVIGALNLSQTFIGNMGDAAASTTGIAGIVKVGTGSLTVVGSGVTYTGDTAVLGGALVLDGANNQFTGGTFGGNLRGTGYIAVTGSSTLLFRNGAQLTKASLPLVPDDITTGVTLSVNQGGVIDFRQSINSFDNNFSTLAVGYNEYQLPMGMTISGNSGRILGKISVGSLLNHASAGGSLNTNTSGQGTINPGDTGIVRGGQGTVGSLTFDELHIGAGATITFDLNRATTFGGGVNDSISTTGSLELNGSNMVINFMNGVTSGSTYRLMSAGTGGVDPSSFVDQLIINARNTAGGALSAVQLITGGGAGVNLNLVRLLVTANSGSDSLQWQPSNTVASNPNISFFTANTWDTNVSANFKNLTHGTRTIDFFYPTDSVTFGPDNQGTVVMVSAVSPSSVLVNAANGTGYTFAGSTWGGTTFNGIPGGGNDFARFYGTAGRITGTGSLTKTGTGSLLLMTNNDYTGATNIAQGTLQVGDDYFTTASATNNRRYDQNLRGSMGAGPVTIASGATLTFARKDAYVVTNNISGGGVFLKVNESQMRLDGTGTWTGGTVIGGGVVRMGSSNAILTNSVVTITDTLSTLASANRQGGQLNLFGNSLTLQSIISTAGTGSNANTGVAGSGTNGSITNGNPTGITTTPTLTIASANFSAALAGQMTVIKNTTAIATFSGGNTYNGQTQINAGTFLLRQRILPLIGGGTHTGGGGASYIVATGAALDGNGTILAPIIMQPNSFLVPHVPGGGSLEIGTLALGTMTMNNTILNMNINGSAYDNLLLTNTNGLNTNSFTQILGVQTINLTSLVAGVDAQPSGKILIDYRGVALSQAQVNALFTIGDRSTVNTAYTLTLLSNTSNTSIDLSVVLTSPATSTWNVNNNGTWLNPANWLSSPVGVVPDGVSHQATFGTIITTPRTVTVDGSKTVGTMNFTAPAGYRLIGSGGGAITMDTTTQATMINVTAGSHTIDVPVTSVDAMTINTATSTSLKITQPVRAMDTTSTVQFGVGLTKTGAGSLEVKSISNVPTLVFNGTATLAITGGKIIVTGVTAGDTSGTSHVNALSISGGAQLDLKNNSMIIDYQDGGLGSLLGTVRGLINTASLTTSTAPPVGKDARLGYRDNSTTTGLGNATVAIFGALNVDTSSLLIKYTYGGDTNLDGLVDIKDLSNLARHYNAVGTWTWADGDFNYDGAVNVLDLNLLVKDWQASAALGGGIGSSLGDLGTPGGDASVPEPTTMGLVGLGLTSGLLARRRRRKS